MNAEKPIYESETDRAKPDPDETPIKDRRVVTQPYDLVVESLIAKLKVALFFFTRFLKDHLSSADTFGATNSHHALLNPYC